VFDETFFDQICSAYEVNLFHIFTKLSVKLDFTNFIESILCVSSIDAKLLVVWVFCLALLS